MTRKHAPGEKLPSGSKLAETYGVARQTVQNALDILRDEKLIVSRQGSGVFVRERTEKPVGLRPHLEQAFEGNTVRVDFAGLTGETLHGAMQEPLDNIRSGRLTPQETSTRILIPDTTTPWSLPRINDTQVFFGFYPVYEHQVSLRDEPTTIYDLGGKDAVLFHHAATDDDESMGSQYDVQARRWFDSIWTTVGHEATP